MNGEGECGDYFFNIVFRCADVVAVVWGGVADPERGEDRDRSG